MSFVRCRGKTRLTINPVFRTVWSRAVTAQSSLRLNTTSMSVVQSVFTSCTQSVKGQGQGITWPPPPPNILRPPSFQTKSCSSIEGNEKKTIPTHAQHTCDKLRLLWPSSTVERQTQSGVRCWLKSDRCDKQNTHAHTSLDVLKAQRDLSAKYKHVDLIPYVFGVFLRGRFIGRPTEPGWSYICTSPSEIDIGFFFFFSVVDCQLAHERHQVHHVQWTTKMHSCCIIHPSIH